MKTNEFLFSKISDTDISNRVKNVLFGCECTFWFEVLKHSPYDFLKFRNFGKKSYTNLVKIISDHDIDIARWHNISESKRWKLFLPEYIPISDISSITQNEAWDTFSKLYFAFESRHSVQNLCCYNFIMLSGKIQTERNVISKMLSWDDYYLKQMPVAKNRKIFEKVIKQIRGLTTEYYAIECKKFIDEIITM